MAKLLQINQNLTFMIELELSKLGWTRSIWNTVFKNQQSHDPDKRALLGAKFEACAREAVIPHWSFVLSLTAKHTVLVPLRRDVLLPLTLSITVPTTEMAVEAVLNQKKKSTFNLCYRVIILMCKYVWWVTNM